MEVQLHAFLTLVIYVDEQSVKTTEKDPFYPVGRRLGKYLNRSGPKSQVTGPSHTTECVIHDNTNFMDLRTS